MQGTSGDNKPHFLAGLDPVDRGSRGSDVINLAIEEMKLILKRCRVRPSSCRRFTSGSRLETVLTKMVRVLFSIVILSCSISQGKEKQDLFVLFFDDGKKLPLGENCSSTNI